MATSHPFTLRETRLEVARSEYNKYDDIFGEGMKCTRFNSGDSDSVAAIGMFEIGLSIAGTVAVREKRRLLRRLVPTGDVNGAHPNSRIE